MAQASLLSLLLPPHLQQALQSLIVALVDFQRVKGLSQYRLRTLIPAIPQHILDRAHEALVEIPGECRTWVVTEDPHEHDRPVLHLYLRAPFPA